MGMYHDFCGLLLLYKGDQVTSSLVEWKIKECYFTILLFLRSAFALLSGGDEAVSPLFPEIFLSVFANC